MKKVIVIPTVVGALGTITKFEKYIENIGNDIRIEHVQKSVLLQTARIRRYYLAKYPGKDIAVKPLDIWLSALTAKTRYTKISALSEITLNIIIIIMPPWPQNTGLASGGGIAMFYRQMKCSLALVGNHLEMGSQNVKFQVKILKIMT